MSVGHTEPWHGQKSLQMYDTRVRERPSTGTQDRRVSRWPTIKWDHRSKLLVVCEYFPRAQRRTFFRPE